jgi:hypothetical protein
MTTLTKRKPAQSYMPTSALARSVAFTDVAMQVRLMDGRELSVPLLWFPRLAAATPEQRAKVEIGGGIGLHWLEIRKRVMNGKQAGCSSPR